MKLKDFIKENIVILDGGMGTILQSEGLAPGENSALWSVSHPDVVTRIHKDYYDAGSNIVSTNTFGANVLKFDDVELENLVKASVECARNAAAASSAVGEKFVALDIGPTGKLLKPYGDLDFEYAVNVFAKSVKLGVKYGVDLIFIETMNDGLETKAALLAAKENSDLPVFVSNAYGDDGKLMTGASPATLIPMLEGMGADAVGVNCSLGPVQLAGVVEEYLRYASVPVILKPNAGLPKFVDGSTVFDITHEEFADEVARQIFAGVRIAGGCCGTTPEYIKALKSRVEDANPIEISEKNFTVVSSNTTSVTFDTAPVIIGERINPTGKKRLKEALLSSDMDYVLSEAVTQQENGAHVLDVNVGLPGINEREMLCRAVQEIQTVTVLPLQIDTANPEAMEPALRIYNGKPMINSVNGSRKSMETVFPLAKKYGGVIVALTMDEDGIPETVDGRVAIARRIIDTAAEYGIGRHDLIFDTLTMPVSANPDAANVTLAALKIISEELGCHTSLGVSNVSFGLPNRDGVNAIFLTMALENGLSAAIINPNAYEVMKACRAYSALRGTDENCGKYIAFAEKSAPAAAVPVQTAAAPIGGDDLTELQYAIVKGLREQAGKLTEKMLETVAPLDVVQGEIIPALDTVGRGFEKNTVYLPQLLMSAEAAKQAFEKIKEKMTSEGGEATVKCPVVLATVKGDVHDIGKNIVRLLFENYGFEVTDLGKDVPVDDVVEAVIRLKAPIAGLSALMTTTVPAMEATVKALRENAPWCKIMVGGAVLTEDFAKRIGADKYAKDAMEGVRYADEIYTQLTEG